MIEKRAMNMGPEDSKQRKDGEGREEERKIREKEEESVKRKDPEKGRHGKGKRKQRSQE